RGVVKFGVLQFPGSCDEVDALQAASCVGDAELIWHGQRDLRGADAIVVPGGFSYGDYLRAGAIARFSPAMESVIAFAREGGVAQGACAVVSGRGGARGVAGVCSPAGGPSLPPPPGRAEGGGSPTPRPPPVPRGPPASAPPPSPRGGAPTPSPPS